MTPKQAFADHPFCLIACIIVILGALNWLSIGLTGNNVVSSTFGGNSNMIYIIVGLCGLYLAVHKVMWIAKG